MTLRHYQIFVTVCDTMNMTAAAEQLYMSQPAVSQAISELEAHYNVRLFERLSRKLYLTHAGEKLLGYARHILRMITDAEQEMHALELNGILRIGVSVTVGASVFPKLLSAYKSEFPLSRFEVIEDNTAKIEQLIANDTLDMGIVEGDITLPNLISQSFAEDRLVLICGAKHPFAGRNEVRPDELADEEFIVRELGSGTRNTFERVMYAYGLQWKASWTCSNVDTIKAAVAEGLGISVISERAVRREIDYGLLHQADITGIAFLRSFKLVYHKNKHHTEKLDDFIKFCIQHVNDEHFN